jgi:hypothetical protein
MKDINVETAKNFSLGKFDRVFNNLDEDVIWNIIGENTFTGKPEVISNCLRTAEYFNSVDTKFVTEEIISDKNKVVIIGSAEFLKDGERLNFVKASDYYEFNNEGKILKISSYCIS